MAPSTKAAPPSWTALPYPPGRSPGHGIGVHVQPGKAERGHALRHVFGGVGRAHRKDGVAVADGLGQRRRFEQTGPCRPFAAFLRSAHRKPHSTRAPVTEAPMVAPILPGCNSVTVLIFMVFPLLLSRNDDGMERPNGDNGPDGHDRHGMSPMEPSPRPSPKGRGGQIAFSRRERVAGAG